MPELPEVETVRRVIEPQIRGHIIESVTVRRPEVMAYPAAERFCEGLVGQTVCGMERRGKFLAVVLESGAQMVLHLRMTGCLLVAPAGTPEEKHTHIVLRLENGRELRFSDSRRFGRFWLFQKGEADLRSGRAKLGLEPFDPGLTAKYLKDCLGKRRKAVKECLLEQNIVAGIGNIYSDEILFAARIDPARPACGLQDKEWERLAAAIPERLAYFIEKNKISPEEYFLTKGKDYRNTPFLQVYGHAGEPCPVCGELLRRRVIGGRSSVYCLVCQREGGTL